MSAADPDNDDRYGSDDYEPESPTRSQPSPTRSQHSPSPFPVVQQQQLTFQFGTDAPDDDESDGEVVTPLPTTKSKRSRTPRVSSTINGRHLMDNTPWTYTVSALQVRMLRIPVTESAAIRELRVFATIDKQAAQSRGSRRKQEVHSVGGGSPLRSTKKRGRKSRSPGRMERYRRSGLIEEAKWVKGDGKMQWTFPMEKFRRLKAYAPRIKAFVYGIGEAGVENYHSRSQMETLAGHEKEGAILSFGCFFFDLRTPDLPERWLKLQNSPFGGEILISSTFSPVELAPQQSDSKPVPRFDDKMSNARGQTGTAVVNTAATIPTLVSGESGEYLQIGDGNGQDIFVLSVFIQAALNLSKVVEISMGEDHQNFRQTGFWLSYSLFDVVVQTDVFYNLSAAEFSPIRDSFRVKSNLKDLAHCIEALGSLTVFMCTENQVLAGVEIPLRPLLSKTLFASSTKNENAPRPGEMSEIEGEFSFPDFDEAVISASFAVELVESNPPKGTNIIQRRSQVAKPKQEINIEEVDEATPDVQTDTSATKSEIPPTQQSQVAKPKQEINIEEVDEATPDVQTDTSATKSEIPPTEQILFKLERLRLKTSALAPFIGGESISVEVTLGEERVSGGLVFCSYTKQQAFATSPALGVVLENVSSPIAIGTPIHIRCFSSVSKCLVAASTDAIQLVQDDEGYPKAIVLTMVNESKQPVGQCTLGCTRMRSNSTSVIREAEETIRSTAGTLGSVSNENSQPNADEDRLDRMRERENEAIQFKEALERERSTWKQEQHLQQLQWKRRFAEMEKARMDELEEEWARREEERSNLLKSAQEEYQRLEQTLRKSLADLETRERRLTVVEAALQREQEAKHDENESLQRRLKTEQNHTLSLAKKQTEAYERRIALLETQLSNAEKRTKQVEADFVEYRQQQRKLPESRLREEIAALKGSVSELEKQKMAKERECEIAESNVETMKAQLEQMSSLLAQEKKKHEARVVDELEKLRVKYIAREEKYVLDGDRDELRAIKKQLDDLKGFKLKSDGGNRRLHKQRAHEPTSPQNHRSHWHTQSRQTAFVRHSRSINHHFENPRSSFHSDHASGDEGDWEAFSYVETRRPSTTPQLSPHVSQSEQDFSDSRSRKINIQEPPMPTNLDIGDDGLNASGTYAGPPDTELGRLIRERKLLLASGAYNTQSYLVRELDRLISVTKANAEHHSSIA